MKIQNFIDADMCRKNLEIWLTNSTMNCTYNGPVPVFNIKDTTTKLFLKIHLQFCILIVNKCQLIIFSHLAEFQRG